MDNSQALKQINSYIYSNWITAVTYSFAKLAIADTIESTAKNIEQIAAETKTKPELLKRFMRTAEDLKLVNLNKNNYHLTKLGSFLCTNHPQSMRNIAILNGEDYRYNPWGRLTEILQNGNGQQYSSCFDKGSIDFLSKKPQKLDTFHKAMVDASREENPSLVASYNFSKYNSIIDIGGGYAGFLKEILKTYPNIQCCILDQPNTINKISIDKHIINKIGGDFFHEIPSGYDVYFLKNVLHNWPEQKAALILKNVANAIRSSNNPDKKRMLIVEYVLEESENTNKANWLDLNFMILVGGRELSIKEYKQLAKQEGFKLLNVYPTSVGRKILEFKIY